MAEKKTQPLKPGGAWVQGLWEIMVYVSSDVDRKHQAYLLGVFYVNHYQIRLKGMKLERAYEP
ncbi:hypothetical protein [Sporomusa termitida]|uniref:Uncharacterized protein n=1 Tax=Sporomusa termitida TaxID=2377 RepID=A0A517DVU6_9FIRM|nr:hypothetical protein [Sporomusa termitida]QDR81396.1 hypothetical protein SPTER_27760 [Sporomusa termitida]